ncbi:MAG: radical SAM protein [Acidobacteriota bacterium]
MVGRPTTLGGILRLLREPVEREKKDLMRQGWQGLSASLRAGTQGLGRQATGCGATIGIQPRCDFDCTGCYLGSEANRADPLDLSDSMAQLGALRRHLGPKGNVQLTDGEVTLRPMGELLALLRHARAIGLIPMLMTHGDTFRRRPDLLPTLVREGFLSEVAIHIDTTQRGRLGYKTARQEGDLVSLREEFAAMIRRVRRVTGRRLRAAMTMTIGHHNVGTVADVVRWCLLNRDAFGMVSFQPAARVGRTRAELRGVGVTRLWREIARGLAPFGFREGRRKRLMFGHPDCTRLEAMGVFERRGERPRIVPILREGHPEDERIVRRYLGSRIAGVNFRDDSVAEYVCRLVGGLLQEPSFTLGEGRRWLAARLSALGGSLPALCVDLLRGRARLDAFTVTSHHFMNRQELASSRGRERLAACVFRIPVNGRMVSMCEVNLSGAREAVYARAPVIAR